MKKGLKSPTRGCRPCYFSVQSKWNIKKKTKTTWRKYFSAGPNYAWNMDDHDKLNPIWFFVTLMDGWLLEETNMDRSINL